MKLAWNAIVRNERAVIERCVRSLLPHIDCGIVVDTGSSDGTQQFLMQLFELASKPFEIYQVPFENFSQARNAALQRARESKLDWDYLLLADADMELKVEKPFQLNGGLAYDMRQTAGSTTYFNRRLINRKAGGEYVGVTHEYLDIPTAGTVDGAYFIDHADGANRPAKFERDIKLLEAALAIEKRPGLVQRYHFYLGQSYFDAGNWDRAAHYYKRRVELGGWAEEVWNAQLHYAHCLGNLGDHAGFVWGMLKAYEMRPQRAEVLYDLAHFFRERGSNFSSLLFSEVGLRQPRPADQLFVNDYVYAAGLREEFSICAYYDERRRGAGASEANRLALDRNASPSAREQARHNLFWYLQPLKAQVPSFYPTKLPFHTPEGWAAMNPSVINRHGNPLILIRTVNYAITQDGRYVMRSAPDAPVVIDTRNWLMRLGPNGTVASSSLIHLPELPPPEFPLVRGFEDSRLFEWKGELWTISTVRELTREGWCEQVLSPIINADGLRYGGQVIKVLPKERRHEKNWMPWPREDGDLHFVYRLGCLIAPNGDFVCHHDNKLDLDHISGGTQVIEIAPKLYLALVHEARTIPGKSTRYYQHRFVEFFADGSVMNVSPPFFFHDRQIEFAAGLALFGSRLMVSYGVRDEEAWIATMDLDEVQRFIA